MSEKIAAIQARRALITAPPWAVHDSCSWRRIGTENPYGDGNVVCPIVQHSDGQPDLLATRDDLEFIAHAPADVDFLLAEIVAYQGMVARLCRNLDEHIIATRRAAEQCLNNVQPMQDAERAIVDARILLGENFVAFKEQ